MPFRRVLICSALAAAAGLTGCGLPGTDAPTAEPVGEPTPVETAGPAPVPSGARPAPAADIACDDITSPAQLDPIFAVPVDLAPPSRTIESVGALIADEWFIRQAGGVACQWSDPEGITTSEGRFLAGIDVRVLPASGPQWQEFSDANGDGGDTVYECTDYGSCEYNAYTATGWWLQLSAFNIDALPSPTAASLRTLTSPVFTAIAATVAALAAPDPAWAAPTPDIAFGGGCTGPTTGARIDAALGLGEAVDVEALEYPQIGMAAMLSTGGSSCRWVRAADGWDIAHIEVLPGGAWAQEASVAAIEARGGTVPTPAVAGVPAGDTGLWEHVDSTSLDIVLGGSWVKISIAGGAETGGLAVQDALIAIGVDIAAHA